MAKSDTLHLHLPGMLRVPLGRVRGLRAHDLSQGTRGPLQSLLLPHAKPSRDIVAKDVTGKGLTREASQRTRGFIIRTSNRFFTSQT